METIYPKRLIGHMVSVMECCENNKQNERVIANVKRDTLNKSNHILKMNKGISWELHSTQACCLYLMFSEFY